MLGITQGGYEAIRFFFVASAVAWVASGIYAQSLATRTLRQTDAATIATVAREVSGIGRRLIAPASLVAAGFAVWLIATSPLRAWILVGLVGCGLTLLTAAAVHVPSARRLTRLLAERSHEDAAVQAESRRILRVSRFELVVLVLVAIDIAFKPGA